MSEYRNRIKGLKYVKASELLPNPKNWRLHSEQQKSAMRGVLSEVGYADALLARELDDGTLMLIDGHLRADITDDQDVPVLILDVSESEADYILATHDPIAGLADKNQDVLNELINSIESNNDAVNDMLNNLVDTMPDFVPASIEDQGVLDQLKPIKCPKCGHEFQR